MNKTITLSILIFISGLLKAQLFFNPDTMSRDTNLDYVLVLRDCFNCSQIEMNRPIKKYSFNKNGLNYKQEGLDSLMQPSNRTLFYYNNGNIESYENYNCQIATSPEFNKFIWDSTERAQKVIYNFKNNNLSKIIWLNKNDRIDFDITFNYDLFKRIKRELFIEYSYMHQFLHSDSSEYPDSINSVKEKTYYYSKNTCNVKLISDSKQIGIEHIIFNDFEKIKSRIILNMHGDTLLIEKSNYNETRQLSKKIIQETGYYEIFGGFYNLGGYDEIKYEYNKNGQIIRKEKYYKDKLQVVYKYKYIAK